MENNTTLKEISNILFDKTAQSKRIRKSWDSPNGTWKNQDELILSKRFSGMKKRCYNPKCKAYKNYGGRGIYICDEWLQDRRKFVEWGLSHGFKPILSIDRIDVNGPYAPWNCRWVDDKTQANNKTTNTVMTVNGITKTLSEWAEFLECKSRYVIYHLYWEDPADAEWFIKYMLNQRK